MKTKSLYNSGGGRMNKLDKKLLLQQIENWIKYVDSLGLPDKKRKFMAGHPFMFKESEQFFDLEI